MKLFSLAALTAVAQADISSEYGSLARTWQHWNFNGEGKLLINETWFLFLYLGAMSAARVEQKNMSEDEQIMWDELKIMKRNYYGQLFCGPWKWYNSSWRATWCAYMEHWRNFEAAYYRLMTQQSIREKNARKEAATTTEVNWWDGKLDGLLECQQRIMELYPADVRARLNEDSLLNNYEKFTEQPHPAGWEGYYTRPTLGGTCYVTKN